MTLLVAVSSAAGYALFGSDRLARVGRARDGHADYKPAPELSYRKSSLVSSRALLGTSGDGFVCEEFTRRLRDRVGAGDDVASCVAAADAVIAEMRDEDGAGFGERAGRVWRRASINDRHAFYCVLNGFLADGATGIASLNHTTLRMGEIQSCPDAYEIGGSMPAGYGDVDLTPLLLAESLEELVDTMTPAGGFSRAVTIADFFATTYSGSISAELDFTLLFRPGADGESNVVEFEANLDQPDGLVEIYEALARAWASASSREVAA